MTAPCTVGDRIRLVHMPEDPCPIPDGSTGTVNYVNYLPFIGPDREDCWQIGVSWDSGSTLSLIWPKDQIEIVETSKG